MHDLPSYFSPTAFSIGAFHVQWYALMWILAFVVVYSLLRFRVRRGEGDKYYTHELIGDSVTNALIGAFVGGRVGYVVFYGWSYFTAHPLAIISPYDFTTSTWTGIYGMSYHGGVIGVAGALWLTARAHQISFLRLVDFAVPAVPLGYVFGRLGNFFNAELVGRVTDVPWGMSFPGYEGLRHPSQLYEALGEGLMLFAMLWSLRNRPWHPGALTALYIGSYGAVRFVIEFWRAPDAHIGFVWGTLTQGQVLSLVMIVAGGALWWFIHSRDA